jgi:hypothetical protein
VERLTDKHWRNMDPWECCGQDNHCARGCHDSGGCTAGCIVPKIYGRLGAYEDTGLTPEDVFELVRAKEKLESLLSEYKPCWACSKVCDVICEIECLETGKRFWISNALAKGQSDI